MSPEIFLPRSAFDKRYVCRICKESFAKPAPLERHVLKCYAKHEQAIEESAEMQRYLNGDGWADKEFEAFVRRTGRVR